MAEIEVATFEDLATLMSHLMTNYTSMSINYYNMFYSTTPQDIVLKLYDEEGNLKEYTVPNRAKDFKFTLNGSGSPEGTVSASVGTTYQDTLNGKLYIKQSGSSDVTGWALVGEDTGIEKGSGSPEGYLTKNKGTLYIDTENAALYIKSTVSGSTGWVLISADSTLLADKNLSNLSSTGEAHFANPSLSNLNTTGNALINGKENSSNKVTTLSSSSTDTQYPSAKVTYDTISNAVSTLANQSLANLNSNGENHFAHKNLDNTSLTASRAVITDANGVVVASPVTSTELGYVDGVTSNIQTQLDGKVSKAGDTMTGNLTINNTNGTFKVTTNDWSDTAPTTNQFKIPLQVVNSNDSSQIAGSMFAQSYETTGLLKSFIQVQRTVNGSNIYKSISVGIDANGNAVYSPVQLITSYVSGTSGYNIWSNGYCEQWGVLSGSGTLSFLKTWANTNYQVFGNVKNGTDVVFSLSTSSYTTISCYYLCQYHKEDDWRGVPSEPFFWRAYGYLASGQY